MIKLLITWLLVFVSENCLALSDDYLYNINWPGNAKSFANPNLYENIVVKSKDNEVFECKLPIKPLPKDSLEEEMSSRNPAVLELLKPLFDQTACSYKVDVYWNYEICHGRHARQYHEQKSSGSEAVVTGYYLGYYQQDKEKEKQVAEQQEKQDKPGIVTLEGQQYPYYELQMTAGTQCDLTGNPREIVIWYVCTDEGKGEIHELTEVSSCKYRAIVLTKLLCKHPRYQPKRIHVNQIHCLPRDAAVEKKPAALVKLEQKQQQQVKDSLPNLEGLLGSDAKVHIVQRGGQVFISVLKKPQSEQQEQQQPQEQQQQEQQQQESAQQAQHHHMKPSDPNSLPEMSAKKFLNGDACLIGGSTWWRHQICFRDRIFQFHVFEDGSRQEITLGRWNPEAHLKMIQKQQLPKADTSQRKELIQYYTDGDKCDLTGSHRWTQLVLRCDLKSGAAISISFAEPQACQYKLIVEGKLLCPIIKAADPATGIVSADANVEAVAAATGGDEHQQQGPSGKSP